VDRDTFRETTTSVYGDYTQIFWPMAYSLFERKRGFEAGYQALSAKKKEKFLAENTEARGLIRPQGAPRLFLQRRELLRRFYEIAGSKKNMARIREWYQEKPELLAALEKLRASGALDVGEV